MHPCNTLAAVIKVAQKWGSDGRVLLIEDVTTVRRLENVRRDFIARGGRVLKPDGGSEVDLGALFGPLLADPPTGPGDVGVERALAMPDQHGCLDATRRSSARSITKTTPAAAISTASTVKRSIRRGWRSRRSGWRRFDGE